MKYSKILNSVFTVFISSNLSHMLQSIDGQPRSLEFRTKQGITTKHRRGGPLFKRKPETLFIISALWEWNMQPSRIEWCEQKLLNMCMQLLNTHQSDIKNTLSHRSVQEDSALAWTWDNAKQTMCTHSPQQQDLALCLLLNLRENLTGSRKVLSKETLLYEI